MTKLAKLQAAAKRTETNISARFDEIVKRGTGRLALSQIEPDPNQPRRSFHAQQQIAFEESIKQHGVLQPILVQRNGDKYRIVAGERRYRAALKAEHEDIAVVIRDDLPSELALEYQLLENLMRQELNPIDRADGMLKLMVIQSQTDQETIVKDIATRYRDTSIPSEVSPVIDNILKMFDISLSTFHRFHLQLLKLPLDLTQAMRNGRLDYSHALLLKQVPEGERENWIERITQENLSREALQKHLKQKSTKSSNPETRAINQRLKRIGHQIKAFNQEDQQWLLSELERIENKLKKK
jgi:ParB family transcriptional regulator, chromosome partitioning protein